jgi:hypothetical protein
VRTVLVLLNPQGFRPGARRAPATVRTLGVLDDDGGAVAEHLGDAGHQLGGVVTDRDDAVGAEGGGMLGHLVVGFATGLLAEVRINRDVAAEERLDGGSEITDGRARADDNAPDQTERAGDLVTGQIERG